MVSQKSFTEMLRAPQRIAIIPNAEQGLFNAIFHNLFITIFTLFLPSAGKKRP